MRVAVVVGAADDQHEFTALLVGVGGQGRAQSVEAVAEHGLVELGQFACQGRGAGAAEGGGAVVERLDDAMRALVEHQRTGFAGQRLQTLASGRGFRGQKALEAEAIAGQAAAYQGGEQGTGAGHRADPQAGAAHGADQTKARIAEQWGAGIADQGDALAGLQAYEQLRGLLRLVVLVQGEQRPVDAEVGE